MFGILSTLAQATGSYNYDYSYNTTTTAGDGAAAVAALAIIALVWGIMLLFVAIPSIIAWWSLFKKAGEPGWAAIIPIYNTYIMWKISRTEIISFILCFIPFVNIVGLILILVGMSKQYDKPATIWLASFIPIVGVFMVKGTNYIGDGPVVPPAQFGQTPQVPPAQPVL